MKSSLISLEVFVLGVAISFMIAVLIKALMFSIRYFFNRTAKKSAHV